jgi:hypothetical protein
LLLTDHSESTRIWLALLPHTSTSENPHFP